MVVMSVTAEALFEMEPVGPPTADAPRPPVDKVFRSFDPGQVLLLPPSLDEWLPADHLARFVAEVVDTALDLSPIYGDYTEARGYPPYDPRLMVRLLVYGYATGVRSSRAIERRCVDDVGFRYLAAGWVPDFRSIARFRRRHLDALAGLLLQSLRLAQRMGLVRMGRVALDGTKLRAAASRHKAMSYDRLCEKEAAVAAEVAALRGQIEAMLADAETVDQAEDARYGVDGRAVDLPGELARREARLAKMREAKAALEAEAAERARVAAEQRERDRQTRRRTPNDDDNDGDSGAVIDERAVAEAGERAARAARPKPKAQRNFTDPESRIMKNSDGAFVQGYNGQAVVDAEHQIIVGADLTDCASDCPSFTPMLDQAEANAGTAPREALVDAGYCSADNLAAAAARKTERGTDTFMATGRLSHGEKMPAAPRGRIPADATAKERMARALRTKRGRAAYARRKVIVEPVFGQMATLQDGKRLLLRGIDGARGEWRLLAACHNLRKIFIHTGSAARVAAVTG
jgi:transposase/cytochrome c5